MYSGFLENLCLSKYNGVDLNLKLLEENDG